MLFDGGLKWQLMVAVVGSGRCFLVFKKVKTTSSSVHKFQKLVAGFEKLKLILGYQTPALPWFVSMKKIEN